MTTGTDVIKLTAKNALKGHYTTAAAVCAILVFSVILCSEICNIIMYIAGAAAGYILLFLLCVFIVSPLFLGVFRYVWRLLFSADDKPLGIFYWFSAKSLYLRAVKFSALIVVRGALLLFVLSIPAIVLELMHSGYLFSMIGIDAPLWTANLSFFVTFLRNVALVITFFVMLKFYIAPILFVADNDMDVSEVLHISIVISRRNFSDFIVLTASFLLWIIACLFILPMIFILPYILTAHAVHVRFAIAEYNKIITDSRTDGFRGYGAI